MAGLTYDNERLVNADSQHPKNGQPRRLSLWEIHPITALWVCAVGVGCDPAQHGLWMTLTDCATAHP